ncbi:GNAT family N-acetyltransferase [Deinococcus puniceus]|uniref:N-acetyltransferase domain-containing protein n=1 Tax=Deinococcus puniceus TaxID=1182568 RepID=A0A172TB29_9DEIO|nr:GNAT family N-acetyltransferase [Deinococcus puniceus]ANE44156.1 hypothetical protein SU48_10665 [Deinococcus puniceus]
MNVLTTPRLFLTPLTRALMWRRMSAEGQAGFDAAVDGPAGKVTVHLPAEWPGDFLPMLPVLLDSGAEVVDSNFVAIERASLCAVGQLGTKGFPDRTGKVEIGYGLTPQAWGRGLATEAVGALLTSLGQRPDVRTVIAHTLHTNVESHRVLIKQNFERTAQAWDEEDGDLWVWTWRGLTTSHTGS